jgi:hypothetical protein
MIDKQAGYPKITVTYDEGGIALWIQARPDGIAAPIILSVDDACTLRSALDLAIGDRDVLRAQLDGIAELPETDDPHE